MSISGGSWVIIIIGIIICFAGICFKRLFEALLGFVWGFATGYLLLFLLALSGNYAIRNMDDSAAIIILIIAGLALAALSVYLERIMIAIRGFLVSFFIIMLSLAAASYDMEITTAVGIALICAMIVAVVMWRYHRHAFIIECAITGSIMINHIGLLGGTDPASFMSNTFYGGYKSADNSNAVAITVIVAIAGFIFQSFLNNKIENSSIGVVKSGGGIARAIGSEISVASLLSDSHIEKASFTAIRSYEKYLIIAPILAFLILRLLSKYEYDPPSTEIYNLLYQTWKVRNYLEIICTGIFEGALIYFVIFYEIKVSAIYQLLALLWLPLELWDLIRYHFSNILSGNPKYVALSVGEYILIWALLIILDYILKNELAKYVLMCLVTIFMTATGFDFLLYGNMYVYVGLPNCIHWSIIVITLGVLVYFNKRGKTTEYSDV